MASILETTAGDRRLELKNEEIVRRMWFGARWSKIRLGVRISINGVATIASPILAMGVCAGNSAFKAATVNVTFGMATPGNYPTEPMTYNAGPPAYFSIGSNRLDGLSKVGASVTRTAQNMSSQPQCIAATSATPSMLAMTITRAGSVLTLQSVMAPNSAATVQAGMTQLDFWRNMETELAVATTANNFYFGNTNFTLSNQTDLDYAFIYWSHDNPSIEISDWMVTKFY